MARLFRYLVFFFVLAVVAIYTARWVIFPLPDISEREVSVALEANATTGIGALMAERSAAEPGKSGVVSLGDGQDALASRLALAAAAKQSIDTQYYIWHDDVSGILLFDALKQAAERGVRVRLLLDDNGVPGLDDHLATMNAMENFEIRLFNPSTVRSPKTLGYLFDFFRMNRRMHNKSMIVDRAAAIIGGRNIGDEYFQVGDDVFYLDMDVLAAGAIVPETSDTFDAYWNSASVFELETIIEGTGDADALNARIAEIHASPEASAVMERLRSTAARFVSGDIELEWTQVQLVADDPVKGQGIASRDQLMITRLGDILGKVETRLDLVSAYFVPGKGGTRFFTDLAGTSASVRILTNALDTTDVLLVHAGYSKYRRELLEAGIELFELKLRGDRASEAGIQLRPLGLSGASLHAKTFAVDDTRIFIGSFNFDPRSALLNCEMGFLIDSPTLAQQVHAAFDQPLTYASYRPGLTPEGKMYWLESPEGGEDIVYQEEPGATWFEQIAIVIIGLLPVEWML